MLVAVVLAGAVLAAVHHAEVALIVTLMLSGGDKTVTLARDTVLAAAMITMNGIVGISLLVGALRHGLPRFNAEGAGSALATVIALLVLLPESLAAVRAARLNQMHGQPVSSSAPVPPAALTTQPKPPSPPGAVSSAASVAVASPRT